MFTYFSLRSSSGLFLLSSVPLATVARKYAKYVQPAVVVFITLNIINAHLQYDRSFPLKPSVLFLRFLLMWGKRRTLIWTWTLSCFFFFLRGIVNKFYIQDNLYTTLMKLNCLWSVGNEFPCASIFHSIPNLQRPSSAHNPFAFKFYEHFLGRLLL